MNNRSEKEKVDAKQMQLSGFIEPSCSVEIIFLIFIVIHFVQAC